MHVFNLGRMAVWALFLALVAPSLLFGQGPARERKLAPGVLTVIPRELSNDETSTGPVPIVEIVEGMKELDFTLNFEPKSETLYERAKRVVFRREIWGLELAFKPLRMMEVDVPQPSGKMQRKLVWYLVYRVRNPGNDLKPTAVSSPEGVTTHKVEAAPGKERRFFPHFVLESHDLQKSYLDRIMPAAQQAILERERPGVPLYNSVEISRIPIPVSDERSDHAVWGVAIWEDVDPRIDHFSVFASGLTNAYHFEDPPGAYKAGDPPGTGRVFQQKQLQLAFWRPGDALYEHEGEFRFGIPVDNNPEVQSELLKIYGFEQRVDYRWVFR